MTPCEQCGVPFTPRGPANRFHEPQCATDHRLGRSRETSLHRQATGFAWDPVRPAAPVAVRAPRLNQWEPAGPEGWLTAVILPDPQIGFRRLNDGTLDPFHDTRALDVAMQIVANERPDVTVWLGDVLDFAPFGRWSQEPGFALTVQPSIDETYKYLAIVAELTERQVFIEGNHDARLERYITDNALAAAGIRRASSPPETWPVLSVPYLLRMEELGIEYVGGYPSGAMYLNDALACIHGHVVNSGGSTAEKVAKQEQVSTIFGHIHRQETHFVTRNGRGRRNVVMAHSPGTLARTDGAVPSGKSAVAMRTGKPVKHFENWQQGVTVIRYDPAGTDITSFVHEPVLIHEGRAIHRGVVYQAGS